MMNLLLVLAGLLWLVWVGGLLVYRRRPELRVGTPREFVFPLAALVFALACWRVAPASDLGLLLAMHLRVRTPASWTWPTHWFRRCRLRRWLPGAAAGRRTSW
jgi:hypothetical protein